MMTSTSASRTLRYMLGFIGIVQLFFGLIFIFVPLQFASLIGLSTVPSWALWIFAMFGARALGFAYGMFVSMHDPAGHAAWIRSMIVVQAIDWIATLYFLMNGSFTVLQAPTAVFLPIIFIGVLVGMYPRNRNGDTVSPQEQNA